MAIETNYDRLVERWFATRSAASAVAALDAAHVPAALVASAADLVADPHLAARGDIVTVDDPVVGPVRQQAPFPRLAPTSVAVVPAPVLGQHNSEVWCDELGLSLDELERHRADGVI